MGPGAAAAAGQPSGQCVRMLAAYLDAVGGYRTEGAHMAAHCELQSLRLESRVILNNESVEQNITGQVPYLGSEHRLVSEAIAPPCL